MNEPGNPPESAPARRARGILVRSEHSGGAFALVEYDIPPRLLVAPLHTHSREDEYSYVIAGTVGTQIGDEVIVGSPGDLLAKPRGVPHTLWNPSTASARVLELIVPGGFERCLEQLQRLDTKGQSTAPDVEQLWSEFGLEMHPRSAAQLVREHGLRAVAVS